MSTKKKGAKDNTICRNRRATYDYEIKETFEAGMILLGSEVKSLRQGKASINEAYAGEKNGKIALFNANISVYESANRFNHEPKRIRELLLHKKEQNRLLGAIARKGYTLVPMAMYFNDRGIAKIKLGLGVGKKNVDKRQSEKDKDWKRQKEQLSKESAH